MPSKSSTPSATATKAAAARAALVGSLKHSATLKEAAVQVVSGKAKVTQKARQNPTTTLQLAAEAGIRLTVREKAFVTGFLAATYDLDDAHFVAAVNRATAQTAG